MVKSAHLGISCLGGMKTACGMFARKPCAVSLLCCRGLFLYVCLEAVNVIDIGPVVVLFQGLVSYFVDSVYFRSV